MRKHYSLNPNIFGSNDYLCHYTSFNNLCSILSTMTLRIGSYKNSNDIAELDSNISSLLDSNKQREVEQYIANQCGYISFSTHIWDTQNDVISKVGYLIPSMWGIYADKSRGACMILDKDTLIKENAQILSRAKWFEFIDVSYQQYQGLKLVPKSESIVDIVRQHYKHIIGVKHDSWSFEQEYRFVGDGLPPSLSLMNGVIRGIVIGKESSIEDKIKLLSILNDENLACYNQIDKNSFVVQEIIGANVYTTDFGVYFNS